jgi:hypothetical protein
MSDEGKARLLNFLGYGRLDAPVWFLGMEEGGGGEERLLIQCTFDQVEDLYEAHKKLGIRHHHEGKRLLQRTWNPMCEFMLRVEGNPSPTTEDRRTYQAENLGRSHGNSLLLELLPIPKPNMAAWDYPLTFPEYPDVESYRSVLIPQRIDLISQLVRLHQPKVIVAYGKEYWPHYRQIINDAAFTEHNGFPTASQGDTLMILTHFLSRKEMNGRHEALARTAQDWLERLTK